MVALACFGCQSTETAEADAKIRNQSKMDAYNAERNEIIRSSAAKSVALIEKMNAEGSVDFKRLSDEATKNTAEQEKKLAALAEKYR
jgi:hypothetical protein